MPKTKFNPEDVASQACDELERECSPRVCSKRQWKQVLEEAISILQSRLEGVKEDLAREQDGADDED